MAIPDLARIVEAVKMKELFLDGNVTLFRDVQDSWALTIVDAIRRSPISALSIDGTGLGSDGLPMVVTKLLSNDAGVRHLDLEKNQGLFDDIEAVRNFTLALSDNTCLEEMWISSCAIKDSAMLILLQNCPKFRGLKRFFLHAEMEKEAREMLLQVLPDMSQTGFCCKTDFSHQQEELLNALQLNTTLEYFWSESVPFSKLSSDNVERMKRLGIRNMSLGRARSLRPETLAVPTSRAILANGLLRLAQEEMNGVSAVFHIMHDRLHLPWRHQGVLPAGRTFGSLRKRRRQRK